MDQWANTHTVNFSLPYQVVTDTFSIYFGDDRNLYLKSFTHFDPPVGQYYKMFGLKL